MPITSSSLLIFVLLYLGNTHSISLEENKVDGSCYNRNELFNDDDTLILNVDSNEEKSSKSGEILIALEYLIHYYKMARELESKMEKLHEYGTNGTYLEKVMKYNEQGQLAVDKAEKINDKLEALMTEARQGRLTAESYKHQLIALDMAKKNTNVETDLFHGNMHQIKSDMQLYEDLVYNILEEFEAFLKAGKKLKECISVLDPSIPLVDASVMGYEDSEGLDFDLGALQQLYQLHEHLNNLKYTFSKLNEKSEERHQLANEIKKYDSETINKFFVSNKEMLGNYLTSVSRITDRIGNEKDKVQSLIQKPEWKEHPDTAEKISLHMTVCEDRFFEVVAKTAIVLREMMRDEL